MGEITPAFDPFAVKLVPPAAQTALHDIFTSIPDGKRGALLVIADLEGNARGTVVAKFGDHWKVAAGAGVSLGMTRPVGYVGIEGSW